MRAHENGVDAPTSTPVNQHANILPTFYRASLLMETAGALIAINNAGLLADLRDELAAARWRWRKEREAQPVGMTPWLRLLAGDLARMTDLPRVECERAMGIVIGADWPNVACAKIIAYAEQRSGWRRTA